MSIRLGRCGAAALALLVWTAVSADNLEGEQQFICSFAIATVCTADGECEIGVPWSWNIPQFIEVDLDKQTLSTTKASGENRVSPVKNAERHDGAIFLQGVERGRAYSFVITEETGMVSVAVAREDISVAVFGACTPN